MRISSALLTMALASGAVAVFAGCAGGSSSSGSSTLPGSAAPSRVGSFTQSAERPSIVLAHARSGRIAVADRGTGAVEILDSAYQLEYSITAGLCNLYGDYYDTNGNLYVANSASSGCKGATVTEYNKQGALKFTYSSGISNPINVTVDRSGNVYVLDYGYYSGAVVEYPQGSNTPSVTCSADNYTSGAAVDSHGNVFVTLGPSIIEYVGGLTGCNYTVLGVSLHEGGGLQIDKHGNLVACDQGASVDIIPPPYSSIKSKITSDAYNVALNKKENLIFITETGNKDVLVDKYPSGKHVTTLGSGNGLSEPIGVATYPIAKK